MIEAEDDLTEAEGNRVNAILGYNNALVQLQRAVTSRGLASGNKSKGAARSNR